MKNLLLFFFAVPMFANASYGVFCSGSPELGYYQLSPIELSSLQSIRNDNPDRTISKKLSGIGDVRVYIYLKPADTLKSRIGFTDEVLYLGVEVTDMENRKIRTEGAIHKFSGSIYANEPDKLTIAANQWELMYWVTN